ncbi:MAG TPA: hypothetical protein VLM11_00670 [Streptosporangiaceae bacterium]|nr:hypothetical protein [Streptosporangiaceae bacterium]
MTGRRQFSAEVQHGQRGGIILVNRFGADGDWSQVRAGNIAFTGELIDVSGDPVPYYRCGDCASITTGQRGPSTGEYSGIGITHSPGCPWLTAARQQDGAA